MLMSLLILKDFGNVICNYHNTVIVYSAFYVRLLVAWECDFIDEQK